MAGAGVALVGLADAGAAVAVVVAGTAVELVGVGAAVEAVVAAFAVTAVLARAHDADVVAGPSPAAVAAGAGAAVVVAGAADAVAVARAADADVVAGTADAAVAAGAFAVARVPLAVADELVRAGAEMDRQRHRQALGDADEVAGGTHVDFDPVRAAGRADGAEMVASQAAADRVAMPSHPAFDHDLAPAHAQRQRRAGVGAVDDDQAGRRSGGRRNQERDDREHAGQELATGVE